MVEEMLPARRERLNKINDGLLRGDIPIHIAAAQLNVPLSHVLVGIPRKNAEQQDGRRRIIVPIVSGKRRSVELRSEWSVGFDATSLFVLAHLGLLRSALNAFRRVVLAPDTMPLLLTERRRVRFHQPSRVKKAEEIRALIEDGRLGTTPRIVERPPWLADEVGRDLAELLEAARATASRVVRPIPIHKLSTFLESEAQLGDYAKLVLSTVAFERMLFEKGLVAAATHERSRVYLLAHDQDQALETDLSLLDKPLFFDDLALTLLQNAGVLEEICNCGMDIRVRHSTKDEQAALVDVSREGKRLAESLDEIRQILRDFLDESKAIFLPYRPVDRDEAETENVVYTLSVLEQFLQDAGPCDAVCVDDRFVNMLPVQTDNKGRTVPIVCALDVLRHLQREGVITAEEKSEKLHRLREAGFAFVPVEPDELEERVRLAQFDQHGHLIEGPELRLLRQTLMRLRSLDVIRMPDEVPFLDTLFLGCVLAISRLWRDEAVTIERAEQLANWVWRNVVPSPLDWTSSARDPAWVAPAADAFGRYIALLLRMMPGVEGDRNEAFRRWVERTVLEPLLPANSGLVDSIAGFVRADIDKLSEELGGDVEGADS